MTMTGFSSRSRGRARRDLPVSPGAFGRGASRDGGARVDADAVDPVRAGARDALAPRLAPSRRRVRGAPRTRTDDDASSRLAGAVGGDAARFADPDGSDGASDASRMDRLASSSNAASSSAVAAGSADRDAAPVELRSSLLRVLGIRNGVLGVAQDRVEMVLKQALPVMGGMASQNVLNLADSVMVGRLGTSRVAAVGIASTLNFQCQAALQGISSGVQAMSARRIGEGRPEIAAVPLNAALVTCVVLGVPMALAAFLLAPELVPRLTSDPAVIEASVPYLRARLCAVPAVGINFAFRGFWNAAQQPQIYMNTLLVMHAVNISLSLLLIFGFAPLRVPALGVVGAGIGTSASVWVGTALYVRMGFRRARHLGFWGAKPTADDLKILLKQALPTSVTNLLFASGMTALYFIVGMLGTAETAAVNVLINLMLTLVLPCMGMGLAAGALSGRALGRGDVADAAAWPWDVAKLTAAMMVGVGMLAVAFPERLLGFFLSDPGAIAKATMPLRFTGITVAGDALSVTMQNALLGVGDAKKVAAVSIGTQWVLFLPLAYAGVKFLGFDLNALWGLYVAQRVLQGALYAKIWDAGEWSKIKLG